MKLFKCPPDSKSLPVYLSIYLSIYNFIFMAIGEARGGMGVLLSRWGANSNKPRIFFFLIGGRV